MKHKHEWPKNADGTFQTRFFDEYDSEQMKVNTWYQLPPSGSLPDVVEVPGTLNSIWFYDDKNYPNGLSVGDMLYYYEYEPDPEPPEYWRTKKMSPQFRVQQTIVQGIDSEGNYILYDQIHTRAELKQEWQFPKEVFTLAPELY